MEENEIVVEQPVEAVLESACEPIPPAYLDIETADNVRFYGTDEQRTKTLAAYAAYQGEVQNPSFNKTNPFTKSDYAALDSVLNTVRPVLSKHGLAIIQVPINAQGAVYTQNILVHTDGGMMVFPPFGVNCKGNSAQDTIAALTYSRRGSINPILGTHGEADDDGNQASGNEGEKKPKVTAELKDARAKATELAKAASAKVGKDKVAEAIKNIAGVVNPNAITEIEDVDKVIKALSKLTEEAK